MMEKRENEIWLYEDQTPNMKLGLRIRDVLYNRKSDYQEVVVADTFQYGRALLLDGAFQITEGDEFCYHEMMAHVPLCAHPNPRHVLIVGGGDGGVLREVLKHECVERAWLVDIDKDVIEVSRRFFPGVSCELDNPRAEVVAQDALKFIKGKRAQFDVAIIDSTDPVDFAEGLFRREFYRDVFEALRDDGLCVAQSESPFCMADVLSQAYGEMKAVFPVVKVYWGVMPTYPSGTWTYTVGSKLYDPSIPRRLVSFKTRYYTFDVHRACFALPPFISGLLEEGKAI